MFLFLTAKKTAFSDSFGIFLAFLSLLGGSAIGFLISQVHWYRWQKNFGILSHTEYNQSFEQLFQKFDIDKEKWEDYLAMINGKNQEYEDWKRKFHTAVDYISHYEADKKILKLAERRWDIYHILSATKTAI